MAADSTMLRMVNLLIALSFGVHREQLEHLIGLTWPRPFLLRPLDALFLTIFALVICGEQALSTHYVGLVRAPFAYIDQNFKVFD